MLKLKLQYFGHLMQTADSLEKTLMLGNIEGRRRRGRQRMRWLDGLTIQWTWTWAKSGIQWGRDRETWCAAVHGVVKSGTWFGEWTTTGRREQKPWGAVEMWRSNRTISSFDSPRPRPGHFRVQRISQGVAPRALQSGGLERSSNCRWLRNKHSRCSESLAPLSMSFLRASKER